MNPEREPKKSYWYGPYDGYESRCKSRVQNDLGVDESAAEVIIHLRSQIIEMQSQIRQLETELSTHQDNQNLRLTHYQEVYFEAAWIELEY